MRAEHLLANESERLRVLHSLALRGADKPDPALASISRHMLEAMRGRLTLSSPAGCGTLVHIELKRAATSAGDGRAGPLSTTGDESTLDGDSTMPRSALRMIYVEDNRINAILFEEAMRLRGGIELQVAEDGAQALALARQWPAQVLVLDAHLPDMSGHDLLAQLRALPAFADVPAFMCSADASADDVQRALQAGFVAYWTKPIDIAAIMRDLDGLAFRP